MATTTRAVLDDLPCQGRELPEGCRSCPVRHLGICAALDPPALVEMNRSVRHLNVAPGQVILSEDELARHVFIVLSGAVALQKSMADGRRQITAVLLTGDVLGMSCDGTYGYAAEALTVAELCRIPIPTIDLMCARFPEFGRHLREVLGHELCDAQSRLLWLGRKSAIERLASFLLMLSERADHRREPRHPIRLFMTRNDIADCLGLTEETVSRTFTQLVNQGMIHLPRRNEVVLLREDALRALAEGSLDSTDAGLARPAL